MGTKHNYTEKSCKVCGETKSREEFPAFGGLTCRECIRIRDRKNQPARYQRDKQNPKYVEENRRRAREYKRKKKREGEQMSDSVMGQGRQIQAMADSVVQAINGPKGQAAGALADAVQFLMQAKSGAEDPTQQVAAILGEGHGGLQQLIETTANVSSVIETAVESVQAAIGMIENIGDAAEQLAMTYNSVGDAVMRSGG